MSEPSQPAARRRWWRRWWVKALLLFIVAIVGLCVGERQLGESAWRKYRREAEQRGVKLDIEGYVPAAVPDAENFATLPALVETYVAAYGGDPDAWRMPEPLKKGPKEEDTALKNLERLRGGMVRDKWLDAAGDDVAADVLKGMERLEPRLAGIRAGRSRPLAHYPVKWEQGMGASLPHLGVVQGAAQAFATRARALLVLRRSSEALEEWRCIARIERSMEKEPTLLSGLFRLVVLNFGVDVAIQGIGIDAWTDEELKAIASETARFNALEEVRFALNSDRALFNRTLDTTIVADAETYAKAMEFAPTPGSSSSAVLGRLPRGWFRHNQVTFNRLIDGSLEPGPDGRLIRGEEFVKVEIVRLRSSLPGMYRGILASIAIPALTSSVSRFYRAEAGTDAVRLACALARYRHRHGEFPEKIEALVPEWIDAIPQDVMDGKPLRYRRNANGGCDVWSIGENRVDDGGKVDPALKPMKQKDWVWSVPGA